MIQLEGISKSFHTEVLSDVSVHVPAGGIYGLIGPGASGKSVLLKIVATLYRPDRGEVSLDGESTARLDDLALARARAQIGMLFQNNALFDYMTVGENVGFPLRRLTDLADAEIEARVGRALVEVGLGGFEPRLPGGLSGGQKKRVGIARANIARPPLLLYDEPTA